MGGPVTQNNSPEILNLLIKRYLMEIKGKAIYTQIRNFWDWEGLSKIFLNNGFVYQEHLNIIVDLEKSEDSLWKEVHSKRRNEIRRSIKEGVSFHIEKNIEALNDCYSILVEVYNRAKLPLPSLAHFKSIYNLTSENFVLIIATARYKGKIIGCLFALAYNNILYDYYAGAYSSFYNKYPNDLIPWEIFMWGKKNGYTNFDWGGAGKPNIPYGVRDYKKKFGGEMVNYGRFQMVHKPRLYSIIKFIFFLWQKIKK